ncbi:aspartate ammonia-lyase [Longimicrobium terrae]|uniref:Aspartate ammonia-lyase n=2 Tax=Longimicrobium terrae TaxID=1639882 RepID=A0A841H268_9BACT|nr:aspartate ammonia-lyase [Longimicrobium terrae]MBB4637703.1 aspartate ammonia-lyase [Longimicrobium terrae]MBB6072100.1 aspartate ammonia-lyase [Longimicrobium terrae]
MTDSVYDVLRAHPELRALDDDEMRLLAASAETRTVPTGGYVFRESQPRRAFGILLDGRVQIVKGARGVPSVLHVLGAGESYGEGSLLDDYPHSTSGVVTDEARVVEVPRSAMAGLAEREPRLYGKLVSIAARVISSRLRYANTLLSGRGTGYLSGEMRTEHDLLGERQLSVDLYYGVQTLRATENFPITGIPISQYRYLINALAAIKEAAALANQELGILPAEVADAIVRACREIRDGKLHEQFVVDVVQGGAGTSTNMNANEVIANRALELLGRRKGEYDVVHPNNHVNLSQSTNDVYPTALKLAGSWALADLVHALGDLADAFRGKGAEFSQVLKMGRTQLQDAVPMTLGQEFTAFAVTIGEDMDRLREAAQLIRETNMGATAIGTGINTDPRYAALVCQKLCEVTGLELITAPDLIEATADTGAFVQVSGVLKRVAVKLSKICNDLRLLSSGPRAGLGEINLPPMQPGSSIMPGKVNPVIPEVVNMVCYQVVGNDLTITMAAEAGQLQLNVFEPVIGFNLFQSVDMLIRGAVVLRERCVLGITANVERMRWMVENSIGLVTALVPYIGYERSSELALEALASGRGVYELVQEKAWLSQERLDEILSPEGMTHPRAMPAQVEE